MPHDDGQFTSGAIGAYPVTARGAGEGLRGACNRLRVQLGIGVAASVLFPLALRTLFFGEPGVGVAALNSMLASLAAMLMGFISLKKLAGFPGVRMTRFVLPVFVAAYGAVAVGFLALRVDYSRYFLLLAFILTTACFVVVLLIARSGGKLRLQTPLGSEPAPQFQSPNIDWRRVRPDSLDPATPLMIDFSLPLSPDWERAVANRVVAGQPVYSAADMGESLSGRVQIRNLPESLVVLSPARTVYAAVKRQTDFVLAAVAIVFLAPFMGLLAVLVRSDSRGPAIYRQQRAGHGGRPFTVFKFRSMHAPELGGEVDRITRVGAWMRRYRFDELPQLFNILRGDMSWVGPRPEALEHAQSFERKIPFYKLRHLVRPGLSGWAQVNQGHVTRLEDVELKLQYDLFYIKNFSIWLDLLVCLKTLRVIATGDRPR
jgi:lipopolysaccharide/colanic/teichoic acid biosynthesis glycosyltransferase